MRYDLIIVGGGAAGYFCAANLNMDSNTRPVALLEKGRESLSKVRISGGGRCNLTHACFQNSSLVKNYPRGEKFLKKAFQNFSCQDTVDWFTRRGVSVKTEADGRMFPVSNSSQSIIDCLQSNVNAGMLIQQATDVVSIHINNQSEEKFKLVTKGGAEYFCKHLMLATGSSVRVWKLLEKMGHTIVAPVPSLFTFHIVDERVKDLQGLSVPNAQVRISGEKIRADGPLLITHWGKSGPAILKLSAFGARVLAEKNYKFEIEVNWTGLKQKEVLSLLEDKMSSIAAKFLLKNAQFGIPTRLWERLCLAASLQDHMRYKDLNDKNKLKLAAQLCAARFNVTKKSTFKEEFVTAGGVETQEIDPITFESKIVPKLFLAGEVLNIDAVTGGFNFQAAWTGGFAIAQTINNL